jgi:hypothetical protein
MINDLGTMIDAIQTRKLHLDLKKIDKDAPEMAVIAHEYAKGLAEDEFKLKFAQAVLALEYDGEFKHVEVNMRGVNGNVFMILGTIKRAISRAGASPFQVQVFMHRAMHGGDYEYVLGLCAKVVTIVDRPVNRCAAAVFNKLPKGD